MKYDYLIVGAGFAGSTLAERLASQLDRKVLLVECRDHIGGNAYDYVDAHGILVQKYGPHAFHTLHKKVMDYLRGFSEFNNYEHRVLAEVNGMQVYLPINIDTMEKLYGRTFTPDEMRQFFEERRLKLDKIENSRDVVVSQVGEELYELFFKNYTKKQWGVYPDELDAEVTKRLPVHFDRDTRYFTDEFQGVPAEGFTKMFERMLEHENITVMLDTDYKDILDKVSYRRLIFTGPIDYFFDYKHGKLPYRSLEFVFETHDVEKYQDGAQVNYPNDFDYTRITEFKHYYFQRHPKTTISYEYPKAEGDPYYPIPAARCREIYKKYAEEAEKLENVYFIGRLAQYRYLNMDQVVKEALELFERLRDEHQAEDGGGSRYVQQEEAPVRVP